MIDLILNFLFYWFLLFSWIFSVKKSFNLFLSNFKIRQSISQTFGFLCWHCILLTNFSEYWWRHSWPLSFPLHCIKHVSCRCFCLFFLFFISCLFSIWCKTRNSKLFLWSCNCSRVYSRQWQIDSINDLVDKSWFYNLNSNLIWCGINSDTQLLMDRHFVAWPLQEKLFSSRDFITIDNNFQKVFLLLYGTSPEFFPNRQLGLVSIQPFNLKWYHSNIKVFYLSSFLIIINIILFDVYFPWYCCETCGCANVFDLFPFWDYTSCYLFNFTTLYFV